MPRDTVFSKNFARAHASINKSFQLALDKTGRVPIGDQILDPRTVAKHAAFDPSSIWNPIGQAGAQSSMDSEYIRPKYFDYNKHPLPKDRGQNPKHAAAGKVVDPTAIETAQGADNTTVDTAGVGSNILEGA